MKTFFLFVGFALAALLNAQTTRSIGNAGSDYATITEAFDAVNDGTLQGDIILQITSNIAESSSAILNASGSGAASYTSLTLYPTQSGLSVSGNIPAPMIDLNGADHVLIDGRVNGSGSTSSLSIINTSTASYGGNSAIRFINGATDNTLQYCTLKNSESKATYGVVFFSTSNASEGNSNNTIRYNNITNAADNLRPVNVIYSLGSASKENSGNVIENNNIYDFFKHVTASRGILLQDNTTAWTIQGNSFYETTSFIPGGTVTYEAIKISNTSGQGFVVHDNYIGGSAPSCGGDAWVKMDDDRNLFNAIYLKVGSDLASSVQNNVIANIDWRNAGYSTWTGINVIEGDVNIGTTKGNTIGASTGNSVISVTIGEGSQTVYGIKLAGTGVLNCKNNTIAAITGFAPSTVSTNIYCIDASGDVDLTIENNRIGNPTTAHSICANSESSGNLQKIYGIYSKNAGNSTIKGNTIVNVSNFTTNVSVGTKGLVYGIYVTNGTNDIQQNTIHDLSIANANNSSTTPSMAAIFLNTDAQSQTVSYNEVYNIANTAATFTGSVMGILISNDVGSNAGTVNANFIHDLTVSSASSGAKVYGILENTDGIAYTNNIIALSGTGATELLGLYDSGAADKSVSVLSNTICISGTSLGAQKSYALRYNTKNNTRVLKNNILYNARSGGTGSHYALYYDNVDGVFTSDYNDYFVSGTGGVVAYYGVNKSSLVDLQQATSQDVSSLATNPDFALLGGSMASDYTAQTTLEGQYDTGVLYDYSGELRNNPPRMGAIETSLDAIWSGNSGTDFATSSNWRYSSVPTLPDNVKISSASNKPVITSGSSVNCHNITIASDASLMLEDGANFSASGCIKLKASANAKAEYFNEVSNHSDSIVQECYFPAGEWVFFAPPVDMQANALFPDLTMAAEGISDSDADYWLLAYDQSQRASEGDGWADISSNTHVLSRGLGYAVWLDESQMAEFRYTSSNVASDITTSASNTATVNHSGWNLVGNPFTYTLAYDDIFGFNTNSDDFMSAVYVWDGTGYSVWNNGLGNVEASQIAPLQPFFVKQERDGSSSSGSRLAHFYLERGNYHSKSAHIDDQTSSGMQALTIVLASDLGQDQTYLSVNGDASLGVDGAWDAYKMETSSANKPSLYTQDADDNAYAINVFPLEVPMVQVPLQLVLPQVIDSIQLIVGVKGECAYTLLDYTTGLAHEFNDGEVLALATYGKKDMKDRFSVQVRREALGEVTDFDPNQISTTLGEVYSKASTLSVIPYSDRLNLALYSLDGKLIQTRDLYSRESLSLNLCTGVYLVVLSSDNALQTEKIVLY